MANIDDIIERHDVLNSREHNALELFRLDDLVALVTGGSGRVGTLISRGLAEAGANVIIASRKLERCQKVSDNLKSSGLRVAASQLDLRQESSVRELLDRVVSEYGQLDILVNNAAVRGGTTLEATSTDQWDEGMAVNSRGLLLACKVFGSQMVRQNSGCIINVASVSGVVGPDFRIYGNTGKTSPIDYAFAKGGMLSLTRYLATYLAPHNIRVNAISPGGLYYPGRQTADFLQTYSDKVPLRRMAVADDIKGAVVFLASPAAAYITGQNLVLDGGLTVW